MTDGQVVVEVHEDLANVGRSSCYYEWHARVWAQCRGWGQEEGWRSAVQQCTRNLAVTQRLEAAQQGVRLPPPVACAPATTRRTVSLGPARRQVLQRQVRAGGDDRPHLCRPAALHSREVGELAVASEGGGVPRRVLRADRLTPAPVLPRRLPVEDW